MKSDKKFRKEATVSLKSVKYQQLLTNSTFFQHFLSVYSQVKMKKSEIIMAKKSLLAMQTKEESKVDVAYPVYQPYHILKIAIVIVDD